MNLDNLILYRPLTKSIIDEQPLSYFYKWIQEPQIYEFDFFNQLLAFKEQFPIDGQLFQSYLTLLLAYHENPFTLALERKEVLSDAFKQIVYHDLKEIYALFHYDFSSLNPLIQPLFNHYHIQNHSMDKDVHTILSLLCKKIKESQNVQEFYDVLEKHYETYGVGFYGLNKAFRFENHELVPIGHVENYKLKDIVGYESQKERLVSNTLAFLKGQKANNVLLYGDSGTGKSTSIKALLNEYYDQGLRVVEVYKHQFQNLPEIIHILQKRKYKFIIYMDDLSFENFELEYKYLKSVIEGGLEEKPDNIVIYATSNRRHLVKETWSDREHNDEVNLNDTMQEKLSLVNRFGITILYSKPAKKEYLDIVDNLALKYELNMDKEKLHQEALTWEIRNGGFSGRTAQQFIQYMINQKAIKE